MDKPILTDEELQAFIDGELDSARTEAVAQIIADSEDLTLRVGQFVSDKEMIARVYGPLVRQPVPAPLARALTAHRRARPAARMPFKSFLPVGMALAALIVAAVLVYPAITGMIGDPLVVEAMAVRAGELHPARQFTGSEIATASARDNLVQAALSVPVKVPNLEKSGYILTGITAYPDRGGHQALQLSYRDRNGAVFTMYMRQTSGGDRFELSQHKDMQVCVWQNDNLSVVMLGTMPAHEMLRVATATYADLDF